MGELVALHTARAYEPDNPLFGEAEVIATLIPGGQDVHWEHRFGNDVWDLEGHSSWRAKVGTCCRIDFSRISARWRSAAKEMCLLQLNPALAAERAPLTPMAQTWSASQEAVLPITAQTNVKILSQSLGVLDRFGITAFDQDTWDRVRQLLLQPQSKDEKLEGATLSANTGRARAHQLIALWQVTHIGGRVPLLGFSLPFRGQPVRAIYGSRTRRNSVGPDEAVGHVLGFCAWLIDHVAEEIVARVEWWSSRADDPPLSRRHLRESMLDLVYEIADRNDGHIPGMRRHDGQLAFAHSIVARAFGIFDGDAAFSAGRWVYDRVKNDVTLDDTVDACPLPLAQMISVDGRPTSWVPRLAAMDEELDYWQRLLVYASMYYLSATLMLRDSQLSILPLDPIKTETRSRPDGTTYASFTLHAYKTKNRHAPVPTTVAVSARVARVIGLLQRLQLALGYEPVRSDFTGQPFLFDFRLAVPKGGAIRPDARGGIYLQSGFDRLFRAAAQRLHARGVIARDLDGVKVSARQVRITTAQAYASREYGAALSAAFGQWDTRKVADGYVGDVYKRLITPVDPDEVDDVIKENTGRTLVHAAANREKLSGKGLPRLDQAIQRSQLLVTNIAPLTPSRYQALGKKNLNLHQGTMSLCVYQAEGALCGSQAGPDFMHCQPGACRNSVMTPADRARYELRRRAYLLYDTAVGRRGANKLQALNPDIAQEFKDHTDDQLLQLVREQYTAYIADALEDRQ